MKLYQLCMANEGLISDQSLEETVADYLSPNQPFKSLEAATQYAEETILQMNSNIKIPPWTKTDGEITQWEIEVGGEICRIWEITTMEVDQ